MNTVEAGKVTNTHLARTAYLYVRQSTLRQVLTNTESANRQYALRLVLTNYWDQLGLPLDPDDTNDFETSARSSGSPARSYGSFTRLLAVMPGASGGRGSTLLKPK